MGAETPRREEGPGLSDRSNTPLADVTLHASTIVSIPQETSHYSVPVDDMAVVDAGVLPTIKCSNCGIGVDISAMGDHVCHGNPLFHLSLLLSLYSY